MDKSLIYNFKLDKTKRQLFKAVFFGLSEEDLILICEEIEQIILDNATAEIYEPFEYLKVAASNYITTKLEVSNKS